jgi:hypothetical protein
MAMPTSGVKPMAPKNQNKSSGKKEAGKIKSLKLKKQTVRDLSVEDAGKVKGGASLVDRCSLSPLCITK